MTGNLKDWLALNNILVWRSQHLGSRSSLGSPEHSPGKEMHWRCWYCTCVLLGVPIVPWRLIPVKPLNGFRISALWQMTSSTLRSEDILYTRDSTTDILNVFFGNLQFKIKHSEIFWRPIEENANISPIFPHKDGTGFQWILLPTQHGISGSQERIMAENSFQFQKWVLRHTS